MLLTGTSTETYSNDCCDVVDWTTLKAHLRLNTDTDQAIVMTYLCAAVSYCEQYLNRVLAYKTVKMYYHAPSVSSTAYDFQLRYHADENAPDYIIKVTDSEGAETTVTDYITKWPDIVSISADKLPTEWLMLSIEYNPKLYEQTNAIVPAILMKTGEIYCNREDGPIPKISSIISILNRHRIKRHA
jgi:hypothetical protein